MKVILSQLGFLIRREFWEHKNSVFWTPIGIACFLIAIYLIAAVSGGGNVIANMYGAYNSEEGTAVNSDSDQQTYIIDFESGRILLESETSTENSGVVQRLQASPRDVYNAVLHFEALGFELIALIVALIYLTGALYTDRKDRSVLFWKSLPFHEGTSIAAKLVFAALVIPLLALLIAFVVQAVGAMVITWFFAQTDTYTWAEAWSELSLFRIFFFHLCLVLLLAIKSLPLYSWILLASAWAKKAPAMVAILPPLVLIALEGVVFGTDYVSTFLGGLFYTGRFEENMTSLDSLNQGLSLAFLPTAGQLLQVAVVTAICLAGAIWLRNKNYEI